MLLWAGVEVRPADANEQPLVQQAPTIPELYPRTDAADPNSNYDASLFTPQVLITWMQIARHVLNRQPAPKNYLDVAAPWEAKTLGVILQCWLR